MNAILPYLLKDSSSTAIKTIGNSVEMLPIKSASARERVASELVKRFKVVSHDFWDAYLSFPDSQQKLALFYVVLKTYQLLYELQIRVVVKRYNSVNNTLKAEDLLLEIYDIASRDNLVDSWTDNTKKKAVNVYLTMLRQVGLLDQENDKLQRLNIAQEAYVPFMRLGDAWFLQACFIPAHEIEKIKSLSL